MTKTTIVSAVLSTCLSFQASANVLITEYAEGSSNNKAIELANLSAKTVNLSADNYQLSLYTNGSRQAANTLTLSGSLAPLQTLVIHNPAANQAFAPEGAMASAVASFNGDDALVLRKNGQVIDSIGQVGTDPGREWTGPSGFRTKDRTLRRQLSSLTGDTNAFDSYPSQSQQWRVLAKDSADGLGCVGEYACSNDSQAMVLLTEYVEGSGNNKAVEISNIGSKSVDLGQQGYKLAVYNNGSIKATAELNLTGVLGPNASLVVFNPGASAEFKKEQPQGIASNVANFNGDDTLVLSQNDDIVDSFGRLGEDPGKAWRDSNNSAFSSSNKTLRRIAGLKQGDTLATDAFPGQLNTWLVFANNTADGLGCHGIQACDGNEPGPTTPGPTQPGSGSDPVCVNCPQVSKIKNADDFIDSDYYRAALAADNSQLRSVLANIISQDHKQLSYSEIWTVLTHTDEDPNNKDNVLLLYSGKSVAKKLNASGVQASNLDAWNREHVWAKSHGFPKRSQFAYTDAHHLRAADVSVNSTRSSYDFAEGGDLVPEAPQNSYNKRLQTWEPRDQVKGDVARMMFYMDVRYAGLLSDNTPDLILVDNIGTATGSALFGKLCTLYQWSLTDVVDQAEQARNNKVYEFQGNRNPFIDHPEWIDAIFGQQCKN